MAKNSLGIGILPRTMLLLFIVQRECFVQPSGDFKML